MRIPPSVVVMSLLTATPFALGIRDVVRHDQPADRIALAAQREATREREALEREEAQARIEAEQAAAQHKQSLALLAKVYGPTRASLGELFAGVELGKTAMLSPAQNEQLAKAENDGIFRTYAQRDFSDVLTNVRIEVIASDHGADYIDACDELRANLATAWGASTGGVWVDAAGRQRASMLAGECMLSFERVVPAATWVADLPLFAVGKPVPAQDVVDDEVNIELPGIGYGVGPTAVTTYVDHRKAVGVHVSASTDFDSLVQIRDALSKVLGQMPTIEEPNVWVWKKSPGYRLEHDVADDHFELTIGKNPYP